MIRLEKGYFEDAGLDIVLDRDIEIVPGQNVIDLNIAVRLVNGTCGIVAPRTSAAIQGIFIANCPVDANYCGNIHAIVFNANSKSIFYKKGTAFCQLIILATCKPCFIKYNIKKEGERTYSKFGGTDNANNS